MQQGFVEKLVQRIVDNIEINVADIHIRCRWCFNTILPPSPRYPALSTSFCEL